MLIEGYWGIELVKKRGDRWLMAIFKAQTATDVGRLFVGILAWDRYKPTFTLAKKPEDIAAFVESK